MRCKYCGEGDETQLLTRSSFINGKVEHITICFRCFWIAQFHEELVKAREK